MGVSVRGACVCRDVCDGALLLRGAQRRYLIAVWPPCGVVFGACTSLCVRCLVCWGGWAVCSVGDKDIGGKGAAAIAAGLRDVPSLTFLEYVVWLGLCLCGW